ncbi:hypothetical protein C8P63_11218 [Melghirimyces profundicolus]|uniref:Glycerophosphoryl diester phosphodiesterase family protein n=1 Tax=Melghirimyces profundicolus TaxID=1242148 RepID=A0A2T6BTD6_9BACL|nr:hypothetical protein [Melghirimyces profundicolus]PTX59324.1 hypothetical protein C8P63_11218 [Melghirimyces profundicolus]
MGESFHLVNRHGAKIWFGSLVAGLCIFAILLLPQLFIGMMLKTELASMKEDLKNLAASPETAGAFIHHLFGTLTQNGNLVLAYTGGLLFLTLLASAFYSAGLIGAVREAALEDRVSVGNFYTYGFRFLFPLVGLGILNTFLVSAFFAGWGGLYPWASRDDLYFMAWAGIGGILGLLLLFAITFSPVVMFAESMGMFRSFGYGLRIAVVKFGRAFLSLLVGLLSGGLSWLVISLVAAFPWLVLQFFKDGTIANIVGSAFGVFLLGILGVFPIILFYGVLFRQYALHIQDRLFPEDHLEPVMLKPSAFDEEDNRMKRESIS